MKKNNSFYIFRIIKIFIFLFSFVFLYSNIYSQNTFNIEKKVLGFINVSGPLLVYKDTLLCLGHGAEQNPYWFYRAFLAKFNMQGEMLSRNFTPPLSFYYYNYGNNNVYIVDDKIITAVDVAVWDSTEGEWHLTFNGGYIMKVDIASGEIEEKIQIKTPETAKEYFFHLDGFTQIDSVTYAVLATVDDEYDDYLVNPEVVVVNIQTGKKKYIPIGENGIFDIGDYIIWNGEKIIVTGYYKYYFNNNKRVKYIGEIFEVDTSGSWKEIMKEKLPLKYSEIDKIFMNQNKEYIIKTHKVRITYIDSLDIYVGHGRYMVVKLDSNFNKIWERPYGLGIEKRGVSYQARTLRSEEKDGYVLAFSQPNYPWNTTYEDKIKMAESGIPPMVIGGLQKISEDGDSIWLRTYTIEDDPEDFYQEHIITDMDYAPDGGYLLYGHVLYSKREGDSIWNSDIWLLKVDKYGCLVPGCQDTTDTTSAVDIIPNIDIMLYPNPATDKLYIYQSKSRDTHYTITDISGYIIQKWSGNLPNHTYILDVRRFKPGVYILTVDREGERRAEKFVVER